MTYALVFAAIAFFYAYLEWKSTRRRRAYEPEIEAGKRQRRIEFLVVVANLPMGVEFDRDSVNDELARLLKEEFS